LAGWSFIAPGGATPKDVEPVIIRHRLNIISEPISSFDFDSTAGTSPTGGFYCRLHRTPISDYAGRGTMSSIVDDRDLYGGLVRLHVLHHAGEKPLYGHWMIGELRCHGYQIGPGTMYPLLRGLERKGYLLAKRERSGSRYRNVYRITPNGRRALNLAKQRVQELFGELFSRRVRT